MVPESTPKRDRAAAWQLGDLGLSAQQGGPPYLKTGQVYLCANRTIGGTGEGNRKIWVVRGAPSYTNFAVKMASGAGMIGEAE